MSARHLRQNWFWNKAGSSKIEKNKNEIGIEIENISKEKRQLENPSDSIRFLISL